MIVKNKLIKAAEDLLEFEIVPGLALEMPHFGPRFTQEEISILISLVESVPDAYSHLMLELGPIKAIEVAGGFVSLSNAEIKQHLEQDYSKYISEIIIDSEIKQVFPIGTNSSGKYFLLAKDDSGVWKYNVYMRPVAVPELVASSTIDFFHKLATDWSAMAKGKGAPYMTD